MFLLHSFKASALHVASLYFLASGLSFHFISSLMIIITKVLPH